MLPFASILKRYMQNRNKLFLLLGLALMVLITAMSFKDNSDQKKRLKQIAKEYKNYGQLNDFGLKWTIAACAPSALPDSFHFSRADKKKSPHGDKLYHFFIKDVNAYADTTVKIQPEGQVLVKETWNVKEVSKESVEKYGLQARQSENDGKWYMPVSIAQLFIMYKEPENNHNDQGWVYGIVDLENNKVKVLKNGRISSCITCHKETKYDRIFGVE